MRKIELAKEYGRRSDALNKLVMPIYWVLWFCLQKQYQGKRGLRLSG